MPDKVIGRLKAPPPVDPAAGVLDPTDKVVGRIPADKVDFYNTKAQLKQNALDLANSSKREAISSSENFVNRMALSKDMIDKSLYEGLKIQKENDSGLGSFLPSSFLDEKIQEQDRDINIAVNGINWKEADLKPFRFEDLISNPIEYATNELPKQLGMAAGMLDTTLGLAGVGFAAGFGLGTAVPGIGNAIGAGAGTIGGAVSGMVSLFGGKYLEGISESSEVYKEAVKILRKNNPGMSQGEINKQAFAEADKVIAQNMALTMMDIPEFALAFMPVGSLLGKAGRFGRAATRFALRNPIKTGVFRVGSSAALEGAEEGIQYAINENALNNLRNKDQKVDLSLSGYWNNEEWKSSVETGMLMGGLAGGLGQIISRTYNSAKYLQDLNNDHAVDEQKKLRNDYVLKQAQQGRTDQLLVAIEKEGEKSNGLFSEPTITDERERLNVSKANARKAYDDVLEKANIADFLVHGTKIKDKENLGLAYENRLNALDLRDRMKAGKQNGTYTEAMLLKAEEELKVLDEDYARMLKGHDVYAEQQKLLKTRPGGGGVKINPEVNPEVKPEQVEPTPAPEKPVDVVPPEENEVPLSNPDIDEANTEFTTAAIKDQEKNYVKPTVGSKPIAYKHTEDALNEIDVPDHVKEIRMEKNDFGAPASNKDGAILVDEEVIARQFKDKSFEKSHNGVHGVPKGLIKNRKEFTKFAVLREVAFKENPRVKEGENAESQVDYKNRMTKIALEKMGKNTDYYENIKKGVKDRTQEVHHSLQETGDKEINKYVGANTPSRLTGIQELGIPEDLKKGEILEVKLRKTDLGVQPTTKEPYEYALDVMRDGKRIGGLPYRQAKFGNAFEKTIQSDDVVRAINDGKDVKVLVTEVKRKEKGDKRRHATVQLKLFIGDEVPPLAKFQKKSSEKLASSDPVLEQYIRKRFNKLFPKVNVKLFNLHFNKEHNILGAAIGNTVFLNKDKAVQSTRFHEYAHLYWDALPDNDSTKLKLMEMFGDEEKAVQAIGEAGVKIAKEEIQGVFANLLKVFWRKVKAVFGFKNEKDAATVMADRIWRNEDNLTNFEGNTVKYMKQGLSLEHEVTSSEDFLKAHGIEDVTKITEKQLEEIIKHGDKASLSEQPLLTEEDFAGKIGLGGEPTGENANEKFTEAYSKYAEDHKIAGEIYKELGTEENLKSLPFRKLEKLYTIANNLDINAAYNLLDVIGQRLVIKRFQKLLKEEGINKDDKSKVALRALKQYMERVRPKDFETASSIAVLGTSAKDITSDFAIVQLHYKTLAELTQMSNKEASVFNKKFIELDGKIKKEGRNLSETFHEVNGERVPVTGEAYEVLSENQKEFVDLWMKLNSEHNLEYSGALPKSIMSKWKILSKYGIFKLIETNLKSEDKYDHISILVDGVKTTLAKEKQKINLKEEQGFMGKLAAVKKINSIDAIAKKQYDSGVDADGMQIFKIYENRKLATDTQKTTDPTLLNDDILEVVTGAASEMVYRDYITPYLPTASWVQQYYSEAKTPKMAKWLSLWNNKNLYGESPDSGIGKGGKSVVDALTQYTALRFLAFNPKGAFFNILAGLTAVYREKGLGAIYTATKRLARNFKKFAGIMSYEGVVKMEDVVQVSGANKYASNFGRFMFITTELAETFNQGLVFIGLMTDAEYAMYDNKGNPKPGLSAFRVQELKNEKENIAGAYDPLLKRPIHYYPLGRALMQFKGWMPEIFLAHWRKEMIDSHGNIRKGMFNTLYENKFKSLISIFKNGNLDEWNKLSAVDKANYAKFGREIFTAFTLLAFMVANEGDEEDKVAIAIMRRALGDAAFLYNLDNAESLLSSPIPATSTLIDLKKFGEDLFMMNTFTRKVGNYEEGELRAKKSGAKLLPAQKIIRKVIFDEDYI